MYLGELQKSIKELKGIGDSAARDYKALGITTWRELLLHTPRAYENRAVTVPLWKGVDGTPVNTVVQVAAIEYIGSGPKRTLKVLIQDSSGPAALLCFGRNFLERLFIPGQKFYLYGNFHVKFQELQSSQFEVEHFVPEQPPKAFGTILPIYPLAGKLTQNALRKHMRHVFHIAGKYIETELPVSICNSLELMPKAEALFSIHFPESLEQLEKAHYALAFEELFFLQLFVRRRALLREKTSAHTGKKRSINPAPPGKPGWLETRLLSSIPFSLTTDQETVLQEIRADLDSVKPMARLLQGDVGSGKTLTAWIAALRVIEQGGQVACMAPTELLARQHAENAAALLEPLQVKVAFLTGSVRSKERQLLLEALQAGEIDLLIGTHALFSKDIVFKQLKLVIIDEQHRFGVLQRIALMEKGEVPDLLLMTATPIPRTLALTVFGDLDVSTIKTMPPGRSPIKTHLAAEKSRDRVYHAVLSELEKGHQAYFVYPKIEESENSDLRDAESMYAYLTEVMYPGIPAGLIHSKIPEEKKIEVMDAFREGRYSYLVSTSVVEVGVDVPRATCMIIEHAERFGLSALHQLRGRVGRGTLQSYAFLIYSDQLSPEGKQRLLVMKESQDGFYIAEQDLLLRGPGEISGVRQSGYIKLNFADLTKDFTLITQARDIVEKLLHSDPGLLNPELKNLREVLDRCPPFAEELLEG